MPLPTGAPILTPFPTFSDEEEINAFKKLYETNGGCHLPCWWGITPGVTTLKDTQRFIQRFPTFTSFEERLKGPNSLPGFSDNADIYTWATYAPDTDSAVPIDFQVTNGVITKILVAYNIVRYTFPTSSVFQEYGLPDKIYVGPNLHQQNDSHDLAIIVYILYENTHIMIMDNLYGTRDSDRIKLCESTPISIEELLLWAPDETPNIDFNKPDIKPLEQISSMTQEDFYNKYKDKKSYKNICIDVTNDAWK